MTSIAESMKNLCEHGKPLIEDCEKCMARATDIEAKAALARDCKTILGLSAFIAMLEKGRDAARDAAELATDEMKGLDIIQRHTGAKKALSDLISDINRMAGWKPPVDRPIRKRSLYD